MGAVFRHLTAENRKQKSDSDFAGGQIMPNFAAYLLLQMLLGGKQFFNTLSFLLKQSMGIETKIRQKICRVVPQLPPPNNTL